MSAVVALASTASARHLDADLPPLLAALESIGIDASVVDWDDPAVDWGRFDLVVIRSTWDYQGQLDAYLAWIDHVAAVGRIVNRPDIVRWNTDKRYLRDLAAAGVSVIPTTFIAPGTAFSLPTVGEFVVKPAVSAGSKDTERYRAVDCDVARSHVERLLHADRVVMVQPYVASVDQRGETGLLFFGGEFSHAICKGPILVPGVDEVEGLYKAEDISPRQPTTTERELAERVLDAVPGPRRDLLYARVDLVMGDDGPMVLELELTEPSVFLAQHEGAATKFATVIAEVTRL
jgi:glutathione synthase/RimK-type ligase-like ATP-grasp enzyme